MNIQKSPEEKMIIEGIHQWFMIRSLTQKKSGKILETIKSHIEIQEEDVNSLVTENGVMVCNSAKPHPRRAEFYQLAEHYPIDKALNKIDSITLKDKIIEKSKRFLFKTGLITVARHLNKGKKVEVVENK